MAVFLNQNKVFRRYGQKTATKAITYNNWPNKSKSKRVFFGKTSDTIGDAKVFFNAVLDVPPILLLYLFFIIIIINFAKKVQQTYD